MTVGTATNRYDYDGDGASTVFAFSSFFLSNADLKVYKQGILQTLGTNYTVTGAGNPSGGSVTFTVAPASGDDITLVNDPPNTQLTDFVNNLTILAENVESALDKLTLSMQAVTEKLGRTIQQNNLGNFGANFNALSKRIENLGAGVSGSDAARVDQIQGLVSSFGNVPNPLAAQVGHLLRASAASTFGWSPLRLSNVITPPVLTGNVNDYNPIGLSDATIIELDADADLRTITGVVAQEDGRTLILRNKNSTNRIKLTNLDAGSATANQFSIAAEFLIQPLEMIAIYYKPDKWRVFYRKGTAILADTGVSGHVLPFLDAVNTWSAEQIISRSVSFALAQTLISTNSNAVAGPILTLDRQSADPAADDNLALIRWRGRNTISGAADYVSIQGTLLDPTSTSEDGRLDFYTAVAGVLAGRMFLGSGMQIGIPTGGDKGIGTLNIAGKSFKNNVEDWTIVNKSADQQVVSSVAQVNDTHLFFPVEANKTYRAKLALSISSSAAGDFAFTFTGPAAPTFIQWGFWGADDVSASDFGSIAGPFGTVSGIAMAGTPMELLITLTLQNGANAGTVQFQFAQGNSSATPTINRKGSVLEWREVI